MNLKLTKITDKRAYPLDKRYIVYSDGKIYSTIRKRFLKPWIHKTGTGYLIVKIYGKRKFVHEMVLETFVGPRPEGMECRHLNGNSLDNIIDNLSWGTHSENIIDSIIHGTYKHPNNNGEKHGRHKLTNKQVNEIIELKRQGKTGKEIGLLYNISKDYANQLFRKERRRACESKIN